MSVRKHDNLCLIAMFLIGLGCAGPVAKAHAGKRRTQTNAGATYQVKSGDSLARVAKKTGTTVEELQRLNQLSSSDLKPGQSLRLAPAVTKARTKPAGKIVDKKPAPEPLATATAPGHQVKKGDSLHKIARRYKVSITDLKRWNKLSGNALTPGQTLLLAEPATPQKLQALAAKSNDRPAEARTHVVAKGETLYQIARQGGITVDELSRLNQLQNHRLHIGQILVLSQQPDPAETTADGTEETHERGAAISDSAAEAASDPATSCPLPAPAAEMALVDTAEADPAGLARTIGRLRELPYRFGGNGVNGIDCSGFVRQVYREFAIDLPRSAREQYRLGSPVDRELLQRGDLLFFRTYAKYPSHVGIYLGENKMVHASTRSRKVVISDITQAYYRKRYIGAKRLVTPAPESLEVESVKELLQEEADDEASAPRATSHKADLPQRRSSTARPG